MTDLLIPAIELITEDGEPLESYWHRAEINLLIETLRYQWRDRTDYYAGGNMFVYYSLEQARRRDYRGPDFFVVKGVDGERTRKAWVVWDEDGRYPDVIIELMSPTTAEQDLTTKKDLYERTFRTPNYFCYEPDTQTLLGWNLGNSHYEQLVPNAQGWLWSKQLGLWLGRWEGEYLGEHNVWLRFYTPEGNVVPTDSERAAAERQRAEVERQRANAEEQRAEAERIARERAEARLAALEARLRALGQAIDENGDTA